MNQFRNGSLWGVLIALLFATGCQENISSLPLAAEVFEATSPVVDTTFSLNALTQQAAATSNLETTIKGINYYPQNTPWEKFWPEYNTAVIEQDLQKVKELGFNTVRIFVFYEQFGATQVHPEMKAKLDNFLNQAQNKGLKVIVTLFDHAQNYHPHYFNAGRQHIKQVTQGLASHPAIAAWDLKNESDLDYANHGAKQVKYWVEQMQRFLKSQVGQPITASYANAKNIGSEANQLDYLTFHYYGDERTFSKTVKNLKAKFPKHKLVLGEFGYHTWEQNPHDPHPEAHQYNYYQAILAAAQELKLQGVMVWSLYDHPVIENSLVLGTESHQQHMGLFDLEGNPKAGTRALQQKAHLVDAQTGTAVTPETQQVKMVLKASEATSLIVDLKEQGQTTRQMKFSINAGVNTIMLKLSKKEITSLLKLKQRMVIQNNTIHGFMTTANTSSVLTLRQD